MLQDFLALSIVALALAYTVYKIYKGLTVKDKSLCGDGCTSCTLKHEIKKKMKAKNRVHKGLVLNLAKN
jgi:hypothetical protein